MAPVAVPTANHSNKEEADESVALLLEASPEDTNEPMQVIKRDGSVVDVKFDEITERLDELMKGLDRAHLDPAKIVIRVSQGMHNKITTQEIDSLSADIAASMVTVHPDYAILASRILVSSLHKEIPESFTDSIEKQYNRMDQFRKTKRPAIPQATYDFVMKNKDKLNSICNHELDSNHNFFGISTLMKSYLSTIDDKIVERPQHLLLRVAVGIHLGDMDAIIESYNLMSQKYFTHASPTLFNSGKISNQLASCFLLSVKDDSIDGIYSTVGDMAKISKYNGGLGVAVSNVRANQSQIYGFGSKATSRGIVPMIKVFASTSTYVDQGGKRPGALAIYLEPWHADVREFRDLRRNQGSEDARARNIFTALWVPDLFMKRVESNSNWTLMCPNKCPGLQDAFGDEFERLYEKYEAEGRGDTQIPARKVFHAIIENQIETGTPYICYKDHVNRKSMQANLGTIRCSNLCAEIVEFSSSEEVAVCNLSSIILTTFVDQQTNSFDFDKLFSVAQVVTKNLDNCVEATHYPIKEAQRSNLRHRPIGIGVQGLADVFLLLKLPFDSPEAREINIKIFETIYFGACTMSCKLAEERGPYETYQGSPASKGKLQFDLWGVEPSFKKWDWKALKARINQHGMRNSLLTACMPTATTSNIAGSNEACEPITSNIYVRRVLSGEFQMVNKYLVKDLIKLNLWNKKTKNAIVRNNGSVQQIAEIPDDLKKVYRTVWEIAQKSIIEMAADRGPFIDQTQSMNIFIAEPNFQSMTSMHFYGWKKGLKTGMYYLRTKPATNAIKFTVEKETSVSEPKKMKLERLPSADQQSKQMLCSIANGPDCDMCGS